MSENSAAYVKEIRLMIRVLERMRSLAHDATMTGALEGGEEYARQQYSAIVAALGEIGMALPSYFPPITEHASLGAVGFACAQLVEYLKEFITEEETIREGSPSSAGSSFFDRFFGSGEFQHIGEAMRQAMPEFMRDAARRGRESRAEPGGSAGPGTAGPAEAGPAEGLAARIAEMSARMAAIGAQMQRPGMSPEELQQLAAELARLAEEQARIAREAGGRAASDVSMDADVEV